MVSDTKSKGLFRVGPPKPFKTPEKSTWNYLPILDVFWFSVRDPSLPPTRDALLLVLYPFLWDRYFDGHRSLPTGVLNPRL